MDYWKGGILKRILEKAEYLSRYDVGETTESLARKLGKKSSEILKLNSNENFFVPLGFLRQILREVVEEVDPRIYPQDELAELKEVLGKYVNVQLEQIVIGTGSDQLIDLISRIFLKGGDEVLSVTPTFSIYEKCAKIQGARYVAVPLMEDFSLDVNKMLASVTSKTRLLFICSPNNPTANQFDPGRIQRLLEEFDGVVAVDEAYVEFAERSLVNLIGRFENLIVFRTFSKAFGLAGLRLGYAVADKKLASVMNERFQMPYSVSLIAIKSALKVLERIRVVKEAIRELKAERSRLIGMLNQVNGIHVYDSQTNFILFQLEKDSDKIYEELMNRGVIVRNIRRVLNLENCLRVTVAPPSMTNRFIKVLKEVLVASN